MKKAPFLILFSGFLFLIPFVSGASIVISEVMYDFEGSDEKKEWIEIYNNSAADVDLNGWRFNDGSSHILNAPPINGGRGSLVLSAFSYALLASDATTTVSNYPSYSGMVIDTVMSLGNTSETLKIIDAGGVAVDTVYYDSFMGANGDSNSLQKIDGQWLAVAPTPGAENAGTVSSQSSASSSQNSNVPAGEQPVPAGSGGTIYWPEEPQIYANAGKDKLGIAGADVLFDGQALGIKKEPLQNARYLWNFGDGAAAEGQNVKRIYKYPGNYIAVLDVVSGQYSAADKINVKITANELIISEASNEFIKLKNKSGVILDISGWFLKGGGALFKFPESSFIAAGAELIIPSDISKIKFAGNDTKVDLLYSNGSMAFSYQNKKETKPQPIMPALAISFSSQANKIAQIIQPAQKIEPTTVVGSSTVATVTVTQSASVIYSSAGSEGGKDYKKWLFIAVFLGLSSAGALFFIRRNGGA